MPEIIDIVCSPKQAASTDMQKSIIAQKLRVNPADIVATQPLKRSIDARTKNVKVRIRIAVYFKGEIPKEDSIHFNYQNVSNAEPVIIVGAGPAGMFAALRLIELGFKPIVLERGKDVRERRRDLKAINQEHIVNPDSNYCFGEGGAGTYSDGKLYTRSKKRGSVDRVLDILVNHGANPDIKVDAHPHIGTNKLPKIVTAIRETIEECGGEVLFNQRVTDFIIKDNQIKGAKTASGETYEGKGLILATGHSARDIFELLHQKGVLIEAKPFAMGVRIEHPQEIIDSIQYHCDVRDEYLPAASYKLVHQASSRGVYSFCMCPGGFIVPSATAPGEVVVNGMSPSKRDNRFANSGIVVAIEENDLRPFKEFGPFAGLEYQKQVEQAAWLAGGKTQTAPAQRMTDFVRGKVSTNLNDCSYQPGLNSVGLHEVLPKHIGTRLQEAFSAFGKKMPGYFTELANVVGVETRTSSPIRIPRDQETLEHPQIKGLYPCGEGAGYAGGIVSAAIDGENCADALIKNL